MAKGFQRILGVSLTLILFFLSVAPLQTVSGVDVRDDKPRKSFAGDDSITPGWLIVKFKSDLSTLDGASKTGLLAVDQMMDQFGVQSVRRLSPMLDAMPAHKTARLKGIEQIRRIYRLEIDPSLDPRQAAAAFSVLKDVEYAEPLFRYELTGAPTRPAWFEPYSPTMAEPNDPFFSDMAHLSHINLPAAWDVVKGEDGDVVVALIDGGTDWQHPDLMGNVWTNPDEIPDDGIDNDENDLIDDVHGWNFPGDTADPKGLTATPQNGQHGTLTSGIVGAVTDNGVGITGAGWNVTYMPINIGCPETDEAICYTAAGMLYATIMGADIINASLGGPSRSFLLEDIVNFATENGTLVIAAAGNLGNNNDRFPYYPSGYDGVLSVGATNKDFDAIAVFSNYGLSVDVFAPGVNIESIYPQNQYATAQGTSMSAPVAAAVAAMVKTQHPDWTPAQVREQVRATSDDISRLNNVSRYRGRIGQGRINALRAVSEATPAVRVVSAEIRDAGGSPRIDPGELASVTVGITNYLETATDLTVTLESTESFTSNVVVTQPTANVASLAAGDTVQVEFQVAASNDVPFNLLTNLNTRFASGDYTDIDGFAVVVNSTIHDTGAIEMQLTEEGNLGWNGLGESSGGTGFRYQGANYIFEGGLMMGNSATTVSDNIRSDNFNEDQTDDFVREEGSQFGIINGRETFEEGALVLVDSDAATPLNIRVRQDSYADSSEANRNFLIFKYTIDNTGTEVISNFFAGIFFDWDSPDDPFTDYARYDAARRMGYFVNDDPASAEVFIGTKLLSADAEVSYRSIDNSADLYGDDDTFTDAKKWTYLSGGLQTESLDGVDVSNLMGGGPFTIGAGETIEVAFAIVAGSSQEELESYADTAQQLWDETLSTLGPNPVANEDPDFVPAFTFALENPYPNPVRDQATIDFELPASGPVQLRVYDMLGRQVRTLKDGSERAGRHSLIWDGRDDAGRELASGVYMLTLSSPSDEGLKSASRKVVVVR